MEFQTLVVADDMDYLYDLEPLAILALETRTPRGYNVAAGGRGVPSSKEDRKNWKRQDGQTHGDAMRKNWKDPEYRARVRAGRELFMARPGYREKQSAVTSARWRDPEGRAKMLAGVAKTSANPEYRKKQKEIQARPETKAKQRASQAAYWTPERRAAKAKQTRAYHRKVRGE